DGVEVGRVALRFLKRHASAARAAGEVRELRPNAVEVRDRLLAVDSGQMLGPVTPIGDLLGMPCRPLRALTRVACIRRCGCVAALQRLSERAVLNRAGEGAVADLL